MEIDGEVEGDSDAAVWDDGEDADDLDGEEGEDDIARTEMGQNPKSKLRKRTLYSEHDGEFQPSMTRRHHCETEKQGRAGALRAL